jgi:hypothetical protein
VKKEKERTGREMERNKKKEKEMNRRRKVEENMVKEERGMN